MSERCERCGGSGVLMNWHMDCPACGGRPTPAPEAPRETRTLANLFDGLVGVINDPPVAELSLDFEKAANVNLAEPFDVRRDAQANLNAQLREKVADAVANARAEGIGEGADWHKRITAAERARGQELRRLVRAWQESRKKWVKTGGGTDDLVANTARMMALDLGPED